MRRLVRLRTGCADLRKPRGLLFAHAQKSKESFAVFALLCMHCVNARFSVLLNLTTEPSKENHSLIAKQVLSKSCKAWHACNREKQFQFKCPFYIGYSNFRVDNPLFVHTWWRFPCNKDEAKQALIHFCTAPKSTTDLIRR